MNSVPLVIRIYSSDNQQDERSSDNANYDGFKKVVYS